MKRYVSLMLAMMAVFLGLFFIVEGLGLPLLTDPEPWLAGGGAVAALVGIGLLVVDVALPVPSTVVMLAHGALFGVALGTAVSLIGGLGAGLFGFYVGRRGGPLLARLVDETERQRADALLSRWGDLAVIVSRPVPIVAEAVAILAGTSPMSWGRMALATLAGCLPAAALFAVAGATARAVDHSLLVFALVMGIAGLFWWVGRRMGAPA
ncbi:MAG: VTT domain-containing protein [Acidobacteriota bacterium]